MSAASTPNPHARKALFSSASDDWPTPLAFYQQLDAEFGFVLDVCASTTNHKALHFYALDHPDPARRDGLAGDWAADARRHGGGCFCNPPYGRSIGAWMAKAAATARQGVTVVCLVPARTDTRWFHDHVLAEGAEVRFVRGRLKFGTATTSAPFASLVVVYRGQDPTDAATPASTAAPVPGDRAAVPALRPMPAWSAEAPPAQSAGVLAGDADQLRPRRQPRGRLAAVPAGAGAATGPVPGTGPGSAGRCENPATDGPLPVGTVAGATALISPLRTVRPVTTSATGPREPAPTPAPAPTADPVPHRECAAAPAAARLSAVPEPAGAVLDEAAPGAVLALARAYTAKRVADGNKAATSDASIVNKHLYWLQTGRLPAKRGRSFDYSDVDVPAEDWEPIDPRLATLDDWERYRVALMRAHTKASTRAKETTIMRGFYDWLRGPADTPLQRTRKPNGEKNDEASVCTAGSTRAAVLSFYAPEEARALLAAADAAVAEAVAGAAAGSGGSARWLRAEVERACAWTMWGTGALSGELTRLTLDDLDLARAEVTWRATDGSVTRVQPVPPALAHVLADYLTRVRPQLRGASASDRVFLSPHGQGDKTLTGRFLQDLTRKLGRAAGLPDDPSWQRHNPRTWTHTYAMRVLEDRRGTLVAVMALHGQKNYGPVARTYKPRLPTKDVSISDVFPDSGTVAAADAAWLLTTDPDQRCA